MKVIQVVPSIKDSSSGTTVCVQAICRGLHYSGVEVELHTLDQLPRHDYPFKAYCYQRFGFPLKPIGLSHEMYKALQKACLVSDVVHTNSLWMLPNVYPDWARRGTKCKFVVQPHGTLSEWSLRRSRLKKFLFGTFFQYPVLRNLDLWVATTEAEFIDIRRLGYRQPVAIIPNGVELPIEVSIKERNRRRMLFVSRIHPKKNVEMLIRCWARLEGRFEDWDLSIVGPDKNNPYADSMKNLAWQLGCQRVSFEGELKGPAKYRFMADSECEVLPTHSENFGMVVAEALACGTPVICSHGAPWKGLVDNKCGWWVPTEEAALEDAMRTAMKMPRSELLAMGMRGREWMKRDFDWSVIGHKMKMAYAWLISGGDKPEWVKVD